MKLSKQEYKLIKEFSKKLVKKIEKGKEEYGNNYLKYSKKKVMKEAEEELIDFVGWGLMLWMKLKMEEKI